MSDMTKHNRRWYRFFSVLSFVLFAGPPIYFIASAFIASTLVVHKITLASAVLVIIILTGISLVNKVAIRSRMWIVIIALFFVLRSIETPIIVIGVTQILDELLIAPSRDYFKRRYVIHKEVDKR